MKDLKFFALVIFILTMGCKQQVKRVDAWSWSKLDIISEEDTQITINNDDDTSVIRVFHRGSFFSPLPKNKKIKVDTIKVFFTRAEKGTIFSLVNDLILYPASTSKFCTDYVGDLQLVIDYGNQFKQIGVYASVCNWNLLSDKTRRLHNILRRKIKKLYLGENE